MSSKALHAKNISLLFDAQITDGSSKVKYER
jgi:hypothetical protein